MELMNIRRVKEMNINIKDELYFDEDHSIN